MKSNFREWTLDMIDDAFDMMQVRTMSILDDWLSFHYKLDDYEKRFLSQLRENYFLGGDDWNEVELENKLISPIIVFSGIDNRKFSYFLERELSTTIGEYEVSGKVDGMIASGFRNPKKPYFCLNEYKKGTDPHGDPKGQVLVAMITAQHLNDNNQPVYGCFVIGKHWHFIVLKEKEYVISKSYTCDDDEIFDIYRILKGLRKIIEQAL